MPFAGGLDSIRQTSLRQDKQAALGYYTVLLKKHGIKTEITTARKAAFYRFGFQAGTTAACTPCSTSRFSR